MDYRAKGIALYDLRSQRWTLLPLEGNLGFPNFSADSRWIFFLSDWPKPGIFRVPVQGGRTEVVVDLGDWHLTGFYNGSLSMDPADNPLVLRDTGTDDIYALTLEEK